MDQELHANTVRHDANDRRANDRRKADNQWHTKSTPANTAAHITKLHEKPCSQTTPSAIGADADLQPKPTT